MQHRRKYVISAPITVREDEYEDLIGFLEESFGHPKGFYQQFLPVRWARERMDFENSFIIRNCRIASHVRVYPMQLVSYGREITIGGIGSVATHPDFRGQGHMRTLMTHTSDVMRSRGYPFAVLWGNRQRYLHFGYEKCGCESAYHITPRSVGSKDAGINIIKYNGEQDLLDAVASIHGAEIQSIARTREDHKDKLKRPGTETFISFSGNSAAYITLFNRRGGWCTAEVGGDVSSVPALLSHAISECGLDGINVCRPFEESTLTAALYEVADSWHWQPFTSLKVLNLERTLEFFCDQLCAKREKLGIPADGAVTFKIRETGECATVELSGSKAHITGEPCGKVVELSEPEMARRLFGTPGSLEFYVPMPDHI
jgi:predicted N-acetyltransferase YhbS